MKQKFKIALDIVMLLMTLTLFYKRFFGMMYHEIAGLVLIAVVIVHIALNIKTVTAMAKKFAKIPAAVKTGLIVDILLLICFVWLGISGVLSSHTILTGISSGNTVFKLTHIFAGGASVILLGVHIGLHICRKPMPVIAAIILSAAVFGCGVYGAVNSSMGRWLSIPYTLTVQSGTSENRPENAPPGGGKQEGERNGEHQGGNGEGERNDEHQGGNGEGERNGEHQGGNGQSRNEGTQQPPNPEGMNGGQLSLAEKLQNVIMFLGMILSCAMITYWIAVPKKKRKRTGA